MKKHFLYEHKNKPLLPFKEFIQRIGVHFFISMSILSISLFVGTLGYSYLGNMSQIDGFYNASMILTGMGPVNQLQTDAAKLFSSFYAIYSGVAFLTMMGVMASPIVHRILHILHIKENE